MYLRHSRRVSLSRVLLTPVLVSSCFSETVTCLIHLSFFLFHLEKSFFSADDLKSAHAQNVGVNHPDEERRYTGVESIGSSRCVATFAASPFFSLIPDTRNQRLVSRQALPVP